MIFLFLYFLSNGLGVKFRLDGMEVISVALFNDIFDIFISLLNNGIDINLIILIERSDYRTMLIRSKVAQIVLTLTNETLSINS